MLFFATKRSLLIFSAVFKEKDTSSYINLRAVPELNEVSRPGSEQGLEFGANVSITTVIKELREASSSQGYHHLNAVADHWQKIGSVSLRNVSY